MPRQARFNPNSALVTGGAGFIGSHLVRRLIAEGAEVRILDNLATGSRSNLNGLDGVDFIEGNVRSRKDAAAAMVGIDAVFHLAALPSVARSWQDPVATLATNAHGTANLVEAAAEAGVGCFVYSSSSSVYGDQEADLKTESLDPSPISPYAYSKFLGEKIALAHARTRNGMRVVALRYFNVFGPRQDPNSPYSAVIPLFIKQALSGGTATIHGDGLQSRDFTYVDNVVEANICAARSRATGIAVNIACGQSHTLLELVEAISRLSGQQLKTTLGPARAGDVRHSRGDISLAAAEIGYRPEVSFENGLRRTYDAFRST